MPTQETYQQAATQLETAAAETVQLNNPVEEVSADVSGHFGVLVQTVLTETRTQTASISGQLSELATAARTAATDELETISPV